MHRAATLALVLLAAAVPPPLAAAEDDDEGNLVTFSEDRAAGEAVPDKALVYVVRPARIGFAIKSFFLVDDAPVGINKGSSYFWVHVDPGEHVFWSKSENVDALELTVEAGKTYWIQQHVQMGALKARTKLEVLSEEEGRRLLEKCSRRATMTERGRARGAEIARDHRAATEKDLQRRERED